MSIDLHRNREIVRLWTPPVEWLTGMHSSIHSQGWVDSYQNGACIRPLTLSRGHRASVLPSVEFSPMLSCEALFLLCGILRALMDIERDSCCHLSVPRNPWGLVFTWVQELRDGLAVSSEASSHGLAHSSRTNIWERWKWISHMNSVFGEDSNIWLGPGEFRHRAHDVFSGSREKHTGGGNQGLTHVKHSFCHWVVLPVPPMSLNMCSKFLSKRYMVGWKGMSKVKLTSAFSHELATFWLDSHGNNNGHEHEL